MIYTSKRYGHAMYHTEQRANILVSDGQGSASMMDRLTVRFQ